MASPGWWAALHEDRPCCSLSAPRTRGVPGNAYGEFHHRSRRAPTSLSDAPTPRNHQTDRRRGSFKVNVITGKWGDFATGDQGGDLVSLAAYLFKLSQPDAALKVADMIGVSPYDEA